MVDLSVRKYYDDKNNKIHLYCVTTQAYLYAHQFTFFGSHRIEYPHRKSEQNTQIHDDNNREGRNNLGQPSIVKPVQ